MGRRVRGTFGATSLFKGLKIGNLTTSPVDLFEGFRGTFGAASLFKILKIGNLRTW